MKVIRWLLGRIILLINALIPVQGRVVRSEAEQQAVNRETAALALYQYEACPFCVKVRRTMRRLGLGIELRDAKRDAIHRESLLRDGGTLQVPCLQITESDGSVTWLYESAAINAYLEQRFLPDQGERALAS